ncbi:hypothetical protein GGTG_12826 [Gaeumannomyces tritici R3-111a-1]|uniref:Major facilitator superfamily (MFS) profile domain-containing protein n=1 Tax=Gaeumannomyces tritici (strain R3-111a-1) TaxID=644352 RepID=J3PH46_GAET3|nr:hypothetical protein GGTG_12826 [Gaeumannomyces tritici R3-111a-1]EJT69943.1 hypothetical protein GGTG_12826 [Gaeumannomyces tritici R3-111a-1]
MSTRNEELGSKVDHQHGLADLTVDPAAEKKLVRKLDLYLAPIMVLFFPMAYLDRSNIASILPSNAVIAGMTEDLELTGDRLNVAVTVFYITYITFEIPAALSLKLAGPRRLIPFFIIGWSLVVVGSAFITSYAGQLATRLLIGAFESGLFPFLTLYLSTFYKKEEQARRVSYLFVVAALSGGLGGLLAYSLTNLHGAGGLAGWRWLFLVEGLVSMARLMRVRGEQTAVYLGESELFDREEVRLAFRDPKVWPSAACQFCANTCSFGFGTFLPIIIRGFGYPAVTTQLLTVPVYVWASVFYILVSYLSDRVNRRAVFMTPFALVTAAGYAMLVGVPTAATSVLYFATFVATTGIYCVVGLNVTWVSNSQCGLLQARGRHWHPADGRQLGRHHGKPPFALLGHVQQHPMLIRRWLFTPQAGQIYRLTTSDDRYFVGHAVSLVAICVASFGYFIMWAVLRRINDRREAMSVEERVRALDAGKKGDRHPDFRYIL